MRFTYAEMVNIAVNAEERSNNSSYKRIMEKFDRVLEGQTKCVRLTQNEKNLISQMYNTVDILMFPTLGDILNKLYK